MERLPVSQEAYRDDRGISLLELLVALSCTALLAAASLPLVVGGATATRRRADSLAARSLAERVVTVISVDLRPVGAGLEGRGPLLAGGRVLPLLEEAVDGELRLVRTVGAAVEVLPEAASGPYRAAGAPGLVAGGRVVAVGSDGRPAGGGFPVGTVTAIQQAAGGSRIEVGWAPAEEALLAVWGPPRALVPIRGRQYRVVNAPSGEVVQRRDDAGNWQPVAEGLMALTVSWVLADVGGGIAGPLPRLPASDGRCVREVIVAADVPVSGNGPVLRSAARAVPRLGCPGRE